MFSLIITIISIALVAALALATIYYGGESFRTGRVDADASRVMNQGQQLLAAAEMYKAKHGVYPPTKESLVTDEFLKSIPVSQGGAVGSAFAAGVEWVMPMPGVPVFLMSDTTAELCQRLNFRSFQMDGILSEVNETLAFQCYGAADSETYKTIVTKSGTHLAALRDNAIEEDPLLTEVAAPDFGVQETGLPDPEAIDGTWSTPPGTVVADGGGSPLPDGPVGPPSGMCSDGEGGYSECPDSEPPRPYYCVEGPLLEVGDRAGTELDCATYKATYFSDPPPSAYNSTSYTVTISSAGFSGLPANVGWSFLTQRQTLDGFYGEYGPAGRLDQFGTTISPVSEWSAVNTGYLTLTHLRGTIEPPVTDGNVGSYGGRSWGMDAGRATVYPRIADGEYDELNVEVRWLATGASSYQVCLEYLDTSTPYNYVGNGATLVGIKPGACTQ